MSPLGTLAVSYTDRGKGRTETYPLVDTGAGPAFQGPQPQKGRPSGIMVSAVTPSQLASDSITRLSATIQLGEKKALIKLLGILQPALKDIEILTQNGVTNVWADVGKGALLPLEALGGGIVRTLILFVAMYSARGGILVIDEIENGIHHRALPSLWKQIHLLSRSLDVQVIATTHSRECIEAASKAVGQAKSGDLALHRLYRHQGTRAVETYTGRKLRSTINLNYEVR